MRTKEVLERLNVTRMTLNNYVKAGKIKVKQRLHINNKRGDSSQSAPFIL